MKSESQEKPAGCIYEPVVTAEELLECLFAEYNYWREADCQASIGATGAISNVIAFATVSGFRADWHPQKDKEGELNNSALQNKQAVL